MNRSESRSTPHQLANRDGKELNVGWSTTITILPTLDSPALSYHTPFRTANLTTTTLPFDFQHAKHSRLPVRWTARPHLGRHGPRCGWYSDLPFWRSEWIDLTCFTPVGLLLILSYYPQAPFPQPSQPGQVSQDANPSSFNNVPTISGESSEPSLCVISIF